MDEFNNPTVWIPLGEALEIIAATQTDKFEDPWAYSGRWFSSAVFYGVRAVGVPVSRWNGKELGTMQQIPWDYFTKHRAVNAYGISCAGNPPHSIHDWEQVVKNQDVAERQQFDLYEAGKEEPDWDSVLVHRVELLGYFKIDATQPRLPINDFLPFPPSPRDLQRSIKVVDGVARIVWVHGIPQAMSGRTRAIKNALSQALREMPEGERRMRGFLETYDEKGNIGVTYKTVQRWLSGVRRPPL